MAAQKHIYDFNTRPIFIQMHEKQILLRKLLINASFYFQTNLHKGEQSQKTHG